MMDVMKELEKFILTEVVADYGLDKKSLAPDENLITQGIIDSLGILKLVSFMEKSFGIKINNEEIIPENFQTLNALAEFVEKKTKK
jgi:acyl carrier protein